MKYQITFSKITEKASLKCKKLKKREKWVKMPQNWKLKVIYMKNSKKISLCKLNKNKQFFSSDYKDQIPHHQHSLQGIIPPSWYRPCKETCNPPFLKLMGHILRALNIFFFTQNITENQHNQASWFLTLQLFEGMLTE